MPGRESQNQIKNSESVLARATTSAPAAYRELPGLEVESLDVIEQLNANLRQLEDLCGRLRFVMAEVRTAV